MEIKIDKIIRSSRKTISLEISAEAQLIVRLPRLTSLGFAQKLIEEKRDWIQKKLKIAKQKNAQLIPRQFQEGEEFWFLGESFFLKIDADQKIPLIREGNLIKVASRYNLNLKEVLEGWYKREALKKIKERVHFYYAITGLKYNKIRITSAQRRWGSCSYQGNLNFNWRLIMAPEEVLDYVVVHEMVHLKEKNHASRFWKEVEKVLPQYKQQRKWLKENGYQLKLA